MFLRSDNFWLIIGKTEIEKGLCGGTQPGKLYYGPIEFEKRSYVPSPNQACKREGEGIQTQEEGKNRGIPSMGR